MISENLLKLAFSPWRWLQAIGTRLFTDANWEESQANRLASLGWVAQIGFPLYYWIWAYVFPQQYESLPLRILGMAMMFPLFFTRRLRKKAWFDVYFFSAITYSGPFFFTFMFLMNNGSSVWAQSLLIAIMVLFHFELKMAVFSCLVGVVCAYTAYSFAVGHFAWPHPEVLPNIPILAFGILSASIVKIGRNILIEEKLKGMAFALGTVSHELRTPLRSVDAGARGLKRYLPALVSFYVEHHRSTQADPLVASRVLMMESALDRVQADVQYMNSVIDLLLANASDSKGKAAATEMFDIAGAIEEAIDRYPFESEQQHGRVATNFGGSFRVMGNRDLFIMVVFNLLKNGLRAIARAGKGEILISTVVAEDGCRMVIRDTGCGIPEFELPHLFSRFYSYPPNTGTGIGLAFCRETLEAWGATIACRSKEGVFTEFSIRFSDCANTTSQKEPGLHV